MTESPDKYKLISFWTESSDRDFKTMQDLYRTKNYNWALFMGHLVIEKLAKALFVKREGVFPPMIHDLRRILEKSEVQLDADKIIVLDTITRFNIRDRYDDYKDNFYKLCTEAFTEEWISNIKECRKWIKSML